MKEPPLVVPINGGFDMNRVKQDNFLQEAYQEYIWQGFSMEEATDMAERDLDNLTDLSEYL